MYVALGDSTGVGVGAKSGGGYVDRVVKQLREHTSDLVVANLCMSGATSAVVRERQLGAAIARRPHLATVMVGGNDLWRGIAPDAFAKNLDVIADNLTRVGAVVVMANVANLAHAPIAAHAERLAGVKLDDVEQRAARFNDVVAKVVARHDVVLVDLHGQASLRERPELFCADGFHPSDEGYAAIADQLWAAIERGGVVRKSA